MGIPPNLRVINGGKSDGIQIGTVVVTIGDSETGPVFTADAQVIEEDTWQVLSADADLREVDEHPIRLMTALIDQEALSIGDLVMRGKRWYVVIYDFDQEPICRREWVETALIRLLGHACERRLSSMAMPLLGCAHDCMEWKESLELLIGLLQQTPLGSLRHIWLEIPESHLIEVQQRLLEASR